MNQIVQSLIKFYQKYLTILSWGSCRYYPTCSSYAKLQYEHNNFFVATFLSLLRILKCNPFFRGGFDYPKTKCLSKKPLNLKFKKIKVKYWKIPADEDYCYIIEQKQWKKN
jgi:putative membrane protein insertion efficiency factor